MTAQFDPILGQMRDGAVTLAEQTAGFNRGTAAEKAAHQALVSVGVYCRTTDDLLAAIAASKISPVHAVLAPVEFVMPADPVSLEGVTRLTLDCPTRGAVITRNVHLYSPVELFNTPANSTIGSNSPASGAGRLTT
jgi:hypothetical protein